MNKSTTKIIYWVVAIVIAAVISYWFFAPRFSGDVPINAVALRVGTVGIHWYGLIIAVALLLGYELFIKKNIYKLGVSIDKFSTFLLLIVITGIIGGRIGYIVQNFSYYILHKSEMFAIWHGGMSIHGAIIAGVLVSYFWARYQKVNFLKLADLLSPALVFGIAIGRLGNFFNQELIGTPAKVPWKMFVTAANRPVEYIKTQYFHPVFLYEMILDFLILGILLFVARKYHLKPGVVFFLFIGLYSIARFIVEFWRYNEIYYFWHLSLAQIVSIILIIISAAALLFIQKPDLVSSLTNKDKTGTI